ncbi:dTDP-4-dehydrorhamnose 3,5-epimerase family protein [Geobacter hydrogenophilus]|uniref:dTDP-4-dehydrorhamnose 3,5-epimerase n=1 Tax=Geobacter hydrogenophilus TaxID=40983 RepID=A0A9W6LBN4_9BACT|nr:dTDP-4-dehydrorhamnose 3,5-epimerase family protein [Geobacter hydrogenophilus]MBT0895726.1 dTDP-4-dehydrorhamnose 3,5-epimerase family protein [Geobacter hydrogenophilus]GLI37109.1 dTDP-4-dehydrorhamnose 3,5-epimerase [Geobacter hydrogenophilus]
MQNFPEFKKGKIHDVVVRPLTKFLDERGWLAELFRSDETDAATMPVMAYLSMTQPGVARGPHEHVDQTDWFCFIGPSNFKVYLWDVRPTSVTFGVKQTIYAGIDAPLAMIVPPGVVHAYKNIGGENGIVFNAPNRLYAGEGKKSPVDEIRHEEVEGAPFTLD